MQTKAHVNSPPQVYMYRLFDDEMGPWAQTVDMYTWVIEQEYQERLQRTNQAWASHGQAYVPPSRAASTEVQFVGTWSNRRLYDNTPYNLGSRSDPLRWEQAVHDVNTQARSWMPQEEVRQRELAGQVVSGMIKLWHLDSMDMESNVWVWCHA